MAWTYDNQDWARVNGGRIELKNADGTWSASGTPEHAESMSYVQNAANSPEVDKLIAYARSGGTLNPEQQAFMANPLLGMDSYGQGNMRWGGALNLFDNQFSPQQAGGLSISGLSQYLTPEQLAAGQQFVQQESPAAQSARDDSGGFGLMELAMLAAAVYSGGAALGAWGAGAGAAAGATTASGMLATQSAALLAEGFTAAEVASSLAGLGSAAEIGSVLTAAGISSATAATLAGDVASGMLTGANVGSVAPAGWTQSAWDGLMSGNYSAVTGANVGSVAPAWTVDGVVGGNMLNPTAANFISGSAPNALGSGMYGLDGALTSGAYIDPFSAGSITGSGGALSALTPTQLASVSAITGMDTAGLVAAIGGTAGAVSPGIVSSIGNAIRSVTGLDVSDAQILGGGLNIAGGLLAGNATQSAANTTANAQLEAARIAAEAAKFKPIGITTRFGQSQFQKDAQGNVIGAGYQLTPEMKAQQDALMGMSGNMLTQYQNAPAQFAPMGAAGQRAMSLGNQYLATDPAAQAQKYMQEQQALLATGRERDMNQILTGEFNRGTYGLATGGTSTGMGAANPRLEAMLNAQRQQDLGLAAQATQGGMDYAKFGAAMSGTGGDLTKGMFSGQTAAYQPYQTALQGAQYIEGLGQQPLTMGIDIGKQTSNAASGGLLAQGMNNAAQTMQPANAYSPWGTAMMNAGSSVANYQNQQQQQQQQAQQQQQQAQQQAFQNAIIAKQFGMVSGGI